MPTDETTLEALERLAAQYAHRAAREEQTVADFGASTDAELRNAAPRFARYAADFRLIAESLRYRLAALSATATQEENQ